MPRSATRAADDLPPSSPLKSIHPGKIRVVDLEHESGMVLRRDCYDEGKHSDGETIEDLPTLFRLINKEVFIRTIDWAQSRSPESEIALRWEATGMRVDNVDRIRIFTWPDAKLVREIEKVQSSTE